MTVIGHLGADAERKTINEKQYLSMRIASTEKVKGEDVTRWINVLTSPNDNLLPYLKKGQQVFVQGKYSDGMYTSQNGVSIDRQVFANVLQLCGGKREEQATVPAASPAVQNELPPLPSPEEDPLPF